MNTKHITPSEAKWISIQRSIVKQIRHRLVDLDWTDNELSIRTKLSDQTISQLFACKRPMKIEHLVIIANAIGLVVEFSLKI